jgi:hypothetical protein
LKRSEPLTVDPAAEALPLLWLGDDPPEPADAPPPTTDVAGPDTPEGVVLVCVDVHPVTAIATTRSKIAIKLIDETFM